MVKDTHTHALVFDLITYKSSDVVNKSYTSETTIKYGKVLLSVVRCTNALRIFLSVPDRRLLHSRTCCLSHSLSLSLSLSLTHTHTFSLNESSTLTPATTNRMVASYLPQQERQSGMRILDKPDHLRFVCPLSTNRKYTMGDCNKIQN